MAVVSVTEKDYGQCSFDGKDYNYTATYFVETASTDGPDLVRKHSTFKLGNPYNFGADSNPEAKLQSVSVKRHSPDSRTRWVVTCKYSTKMPEREGDDGGGPPPPSGGTDDRPGKDLEPRRETFEIRFNVHTEDGYIMEWLGTGRTGSTKEDTCCEWSREEFIHVVSNRFSGGGGTGDGAEVRPMVSFIGPVHNSAGQPLDPPSVERYLPVFRYSLNDGWAAIADASKALGKVNSKEVIVKNLNDDEIQKCAPGTLLFSSFGVEPTVSGDIFNWVSYEFEYDECGHGVYVLDKGKSIFVEYEEVTTLGTDDGVREDIVIVNGVEVMKDEAGDTVEEEVWFDGKGAPLVDALSPYIMKWRPGICYQTDLNKLEPFKTF